METILHFDKLFYHFSCSDMWVVSLKKGRGYGWRKKSSEAELKRKIVKGDKVETEKLLFIWI